MAHHRRVAQPWGDATTTHVEGHTIGGFVSARRAGDARLVADRELQGDPRSPFYAADE